MTYGGFGSRASLLAALALGCASIPSGTAPADPSPQETALATEAARTPHASPTIRPTQAVSPTPGATIETLGLGPDVPLGAGTYRLNPSALGARFPPVLITVPDGWNSLSSTFFNNHQPGESDDEYVAVQFWNVGHVYAHPCNWSGSLFNPGPTVDDLAQALIDVPLRNATEPIDVTIDGYAGKYLEWSVPTEVDFTDCDAEGGEHFFKSWTGNGMASDRYHQGPGQVDRVWMLDVEGRRLVIDAFYMPDTTSAERALLTEVVESIRVDH